MFKETLSTLKNRINRSYLNKGKILAVLPKLLKSTLS